MRERSVSDASHLKTTRMVNIINALRLIEENKPFLVGERRVEEC